MNTLPCTILLLSLLSLALALAQETTVTTPSPESRVDGATLAEEIQARRPAPKEMPAAVKAARVQAQVTVPGAAGGAPLTIARIDPPALPAPVATPRAVAAFTDEQRAAIRAAAPLRSRLFAPTATVFPGGVSLVNWGHIEAVKNYQEYEAWVPWDLSSIALVGDFEVGRTRYSLLAHAHPAAGRALAREVPALSAIKDGHLLTNGDPANPDALEPLRALAAIYKAEAPQLATAHADQQARQRAAEAWEKQNPEPPQPAEIRFWKITPPPAEKPDAAPAAPSAE